MTRVLLVGSDRYFAERCVARGLDVVMIRNVGAARNGLIRFPAEVTEILVGDQTHPEALLGGLAHAGLSVADFDAVYTNYEFSLVSAALLARAAGVAGPEVGTALAMRDKFVQKRRLAAAGVPVARCRVFDEPADALDGFDLDLPVVWKPVSGAGTEATFRIDDLAGLSRAVADHSAVRSPQRSVVVEEYVAGLEFVLDGWVYDGEVGFSSLGRYARPCLETVAGRAALRMYRCTDRTHPGLRAEADALLTAALTALGLHDGVFHLEFFRGEDGRLTFSECAARRGGALIEEEVRRAHGVSLADAAVQLTLGRRPDQLDRSASSGPGSGAVEVGSVHPRPVSGVVLDLPRRAELMALPGVDHVRIDTYLGAAWDADGGSTDSRAGAVLVSADDLGELDRRLDAAEAAFLAGCRISPAGGPARDRRAYQAEVMGRTDLTDVSYPWPPARSPAPSPAAEPSRRSDSPRLEPIR